MAKTPFEPASPAADLSASFQAALPALPPNRGHQAALSGAGSLAEARPAPPPSAAPTLAGATPATARLAALAWHGREAGGLRPGGEATHERAPRSTEHAVMASVFGGSACGPQLPEWISARTPTRRGGARESAGAAQAFSRTSGGKCSTAARIAFLASCGRSQLHGLGGRSPSGCDREDILLDTNIVARVLGPPPSLQRDGIGNLGHVLYVCVP